MSGRWQAMCGTLVVLLMALVAAPARAGLIAYWTFEGASDTAREADKTGAGHDITRYSGAAFGADVPTGGGSYALDCTPSNAYAIVGGNENDFDLGSSITVTAWVKGWPGAWNPFIAKNGEPNGWQVRNHGGAATMDWTTRGTGFPNNGDLEGTSTVVGNGQWHFIAVTFDGTSKKMYVDYTNPANPPDKLETGGPGSISDSPDPVVFAARYNGGIQNQSPVKLDNVAIFNTALSASELAFLGNGGSPFDLPHPVAELATSSGLISGKALIASGNTASPPDRYRLEVRQPSIQPGLQGYYFSNANLPYPWPANPVNWALYTPNANGTRVDANIDFPTQFANWVPGLTNDAWGYPGNGKENFSVVWLGYISAPVDGTYSFHGMADDRAWLAIDGVMANGVGWGDNDDPNGRWDVGAQWTLTAGLHAIEFRMHEFNGGEDNHLWWDRPDDALGFIIVDPAFFSHLDEWRVLTDVTGTQVGDLLSMGVFPPDGRFGLPNGDYDLRLTVWGAGGMAQDSVNDFVLTPEPTTLAFLGAGLLALARRRKRQQA